MKIIGMLGGMSWESTKLYYHHLNEIVKQRCGGLSSARILLNSVNFATLEACLREQDWKQIANLLSEAGQSVEKGGADGLIICTNTMHKVFAELEAQLHIPIFHIADALGQQLVADGVGKVGLLGTRFTMTDDFFARRLAEKFDIETIVPNAEDVKRIDDIIFHELCLGDIRADSREIYLQIMDKLMAEGAGGIALACTEIELLVKPEHTSHPLYDTTYLHAKAAVDWALSD